MEKQFCIELAAESKNLMAIRRFFLATAKDIIPADDAGYLEVCLNEVCENIIRHGYEIKEHGKINIKVQFGKKDTRITVIDWGKPFDPLSYETMSNEELVKKGIKGKLGIRTIKKICDKIYYERLKNKNKLVMIRKHRKEKNRPV